MDYGAIVGLASIVRRIVVWQLRPVGDTGGRLSES